MSIINLGSFSTVYVIFKGPNTGIAFDYAYGSWSRRNGWGNGSNSNEIVIPLDPLTALRMGIVQLFELNLPPGLEAAYNMLK